MIDAEILKSHYDGDSELKSILNEEESRKSLIRLAVLKVVLLNRAKPKRSKTNESDEITILKKQVNDYELSTNKLKQEHSTKYKLQEAKLESAKDEINKLKEQAKLLTSQIQAQTNNQYGTSQYHVPTASEFKPKISLSNLPKPNSSLGIQKFSLTKPTTAFSAKNYLSPTFNSINKSVYGSDTLGSVLTPLQSRVKGKPRGKYITSRTLHTLGSPTSNRFNTLMGKASGAGAVVSSDGKTAENVNNGSDKTITSNKEQTSTAFQPSPAKTPSRQAFIDNFDNSSGSSSPSPDFTPTRLSSDKTTLPSTKDSAEDDFATKTSVQSKLESLTQTDDETFASANSTLLNSANNSAAEIQVKKKTKKLQLWKSGASKVPLTAPERKSQSLGLEDENLNSLNYYEDGNFANDESPPKPSKKRIIEESSPEPSINKRRKHNVFKID
ncbi:uncharacterized protein RJT20DRAFT_124139 [Scheffersomyces xylosifermentans]|uniref:uncharacterized protein n=1 Tax=Scheffersomyces xylosifermentans TaxID=1304137 RepID=UPI00315D6C3A